MWAIRSSDMVFSDGKLQRLNSSFAVINEELEDVGVVNVNEKRLVMRFLHLY